MHILKRYFDLCFGILVAVTVVMICIVLIIEKIKFKKDMDKAKQDNP